MKIAVIVLTYNRPAALLAVLRALAPQCQASDEVWIADDGSSAENVQRVRDGLPPFACGLSHVWHPDVGFSAARARNMAALRAQADYLVFLDGDCVPHPRWLQQHRTLAESRHFVNGSRVLLSATFTKQVEQGQVALASMTWRDWLRAWLRGDSNKLTHLVNWPGSVARYQAKFKWRGIRSCNFGVWRKDYFAVNGFDERFSGWGHEDADLVLRLHNLGLKRKNGFCATEVFHLWHREQDRGQEQTNRSLLLARLQDRLVRAKAGLDASPESTEVRVSQWNG